MKLFKRSKPPARAIAAAAAGDDLESLTQSLGADLLALARSKAGGMFSSRFWSDKLMEWAMKDPAFGNAAVLARWRRDFPLANVAQIAGANHYIQEDAPEAVAAAVRRVPDRIGPR